MEAFVGSIFPVGFSFAPIGWMSCEGQLLPISNYQTLFALIGTTFGGDGVSSFGLPDLRGRTIVGQGTGPGLATVNYGESDGVTSVTMITNQMPAHTHLVVDKGNGLSASSNDPTNNYYGGGGSNIYDTAWDGSSVMNPGCVTASSAGGSQPMDIMNPYLATYHIICIEGIFPARN